MADKLFLLRPGFRDPAAGEGNFYCPFSAAIEGVLNYFPHLRSRIDVHEVDFPRPRPAVAALLGPITRVARCLYWIPKVPRPPALQCRKLQMGSAI